MIDFDDTDVKLRSGPEKQKELLSQATPVLTDNSVN